MGEKQEYTKGSVTSLVVDIILLLGRFLAIPRIYVFTEYCVRVHEWNLSQSLKTRVTVTSLVGLLVVAG